MESVNIEEINYKNYGKCIRLWNKEVELYVTVDKGPRIIRFGFIGMENEFAEDVPATMKVFDDEWNLMGGHRLWHSPEDSTRTYIPDNSPLKWNINENEITVYQDIEPWTQIKKEIKIQLDCNENKVKITHKLTNKNAWRIELAAWALTVMAPGGIQVIPQTSRNTGLLPNRRIALWPYSRMNDTRVIWGDKFILLKQDSLRDEAFKLGISNESGWAAYFNHGNLFVKKFQYDLNKSYPDYGVSYETYTNKYMMEMETLSPLTALNFDESVSHVEQWELFKDVDFKEQDEPSIQRIFN